MTDTDQTIAPEDVPADIPRYEQHELGKMFPQRPADEFKALVANIKEHGLLEPIVLHEGKVLDGWHRYLACREVNEPDMPVRTISPDIRDPREYVVSKNYHRRHLEKSQRALIAAEMVNSKKGGDRKSDQSTNLGNDREVTQADAARRFAVSVNSIGFACKVLAEAEAEVVECVRDGEAAVSDAVKVVADAPEHQTRAVVLLAEGKAKSLADGVRLSKAEHDAMPGVDGSGEVKRPASPPVEAPAAVRSPVDDATDEAKAPEQTKAPAADDPKAPAADSTESKTETRRESPAGQQTEEPKPTPAGTDTDSTGSDSTQAGDDLRQQGVPMSNYGVMLARHKEPGEKPGDGHVIDYPEKPSYWLEIVDTKGYRVDGVNQLTAEGEKQLRRLARDVGEKPSRWQFDD